MNIRQFLREALNRPGHLILIERPIVEKILRELGPDPDSTPPAIALTKEEIAALDDKDEDLPRVDFG